MSIWKTQANLESINRFNADTMVEYLGIIITEIGDGYLKGTMPIDHRTKQPFGIMHGGASATLAETVGSLAANYCVDLTKQYCVGLDINTSHIKMVRNGIIIATAKPAHIGKSTHVWQVYITNEKEELVALSRLTMAVLDKQV
jgi:1,4-dihydroxy-2-naphthoyl-CoA hydrolase